MASDKIQEEKQENNQKSTPDKKEDDKQFQKAIDETDIAIFKR
jgi:hypothetical protein